MICCFVAAAAFVHGLAAGGPVLALSVVPMSLADVAREAECIVHGHIVATRAGDDEHGVPALWVTVAVTEPLKGPAAAEITFKQLGTPAGGGRGLGGHLPRYPVGMEAVLFLRRPSRLGFTSPVGFGQGYYPIRRGAAGGGASDVIGSVALDETTVGPFLATVRALVGGRQ
jgi:hypothetical protein